MNILIVGVLLAVGLLSILGLVWVIRSEPNTRTSTQVRPTAPTIPAVPPAPQAPVVPPVTEKSNSPVAQTRRAAVEPSPVTETFSVPKDATYPTQSEENYFPVSRGQLHELSAQLHTLHQQAQELERRLSVLTNMIEHIEHLQDGRLGIEEESETEATWSAAAPLEKDIPATRSGVRP